MKTSAVQVNLEVDPPSLTLVGGPRDRQAANTAVSMAEPPPLPPTIHQKTTVRTMSALSTTSADWLVCSVTNRRKHAPSATITGTVMAKLAPDGVGHRLSGNWLHQLATKFRTTGRIRRSVDRSLGPAVTVLLSVAAMAQALKVWQWRPGDPMALDGDANFMTMQIKDILDHGWYGGNLDVGAPFGQNASAFPHADHLHLLLVRLIGFFSDNPFTVGALYFMLGFPLAALTMYWLARQRHLGRPGSVVAGVLFSVVPGHQTMFPHLWLASYWVVPLGLWLVLRTSGGEPLLRIKIDWRDPSQRRSSIRLNLTTIFCVLSIALGGIYYSAFTLLLLAVTLVLRLVATRDRLSAVRAAALLITTGAVSLAAVTSVAAGQDKRTLVSDLSQRGFWESEMYAGKLMDLILPWIHHRLSSLQYLTVAYNSRTTPTPEEPALGIIALLGVVALTVMMLAWLIPQRLHPLHPELSVLGLLSVVAISFFSIGGLGSFVGLFVTSQIRTWSRLFVIIALIGLLAVGHWVTVVSRRNRVLGLLTAAALLIIGVLDQTNPAMAPDYQALRNQVGDLTTFTQGIEARAARGCSVFQLPIVQFPESPSLFDMTVYEHLRPYLASVSLRWSYGAFRGTGLADWQLALPQTSAASLVDDIVAAGFCAVELDRAGFSDHGTKIAGELTALLGMPISTTRDSQLVAWDLTSERTDLTSRIGADRVKATGDLVLHPLVVYADRGAYEVEHEGQTTYQWTGPSPAIDVHNFGPTEVEGVRLTFSMSAPDSAPRRFTVHLPSGATQVVEVNDGSTQQVQVVVDAAPGPNAVTITTNGSGVTIGQATSPTSADNRIVYGKLINLTAKVPDPNVRVGVVQQRVE